ncbi:MAG: hypothetical protein BM562_15510 [Alphaproteobacteria bacterium MedPE-SWcel]|mgnify:CR=1 FL=1|nr:MAG: hypothetical protein BM562_15510 [Alphaproteobacteria bacterium MedPE-SWcel]
MVQNNKVLTVSYGTFSCTLEGFEDSFGTMKAIAEYFRDLAADDRYFGAEPPQPDADMLARIAQREIARQVEARSGEGGIHLRAAATPEAEAPAPDPAAASVSTAALTAPVAAAEAHSPSEDATAVPASASETVRSGTAAATAAPADAEPAPDVAADQNPDQNPDQDPEQTSDQLRDQLPGRNPSHESHEQSDSPKSDTLLWGVHTNLTPTSPSARASEPDTEFLTPDLVAPTAQPEDAGPGADSIAAKLQRIRAVVAKTPVEEDDFTEDEHADSFPGDEKPTLEDVLTQAAEAEPQTAEPQAEQPQTTASIDEEGEDSISAMLDRLHLSNELRAAEEEAEGPDATAPPSDHDSIESGVLEAGVSDSQTAPAQNAPEHNTPEQNTPEPVAASAPAEPDPTAVTDSHSSSEDRSEQTPRAPQGTAAAAMGVPAITKPVTPRRPVKGRVIRVKRAQVDDPVIEARAEPVADEAGAATEPRKPRPARPRPAPLPSSLSEDDEAELLAELAAVEAELVASSAPSGDTLAVDDDARGLDEDETEAEVMSPSDTLAPPPVEAPSTARPTSPAREILTSADSSPDGDLSRLIATANDRLSDEQAATSRATYNQLRAAVAAAQADKDGGDEARREARTRAFREDLASVVHPRRSDRADTTAAIAPGAGEQNPIPESRPAPLKLVAEQRIDATADAAEEVSSSEPRSPAAAKAPNTPAAPVRPRRVSSEILQGDEADAHQQRSQDGAFARYASEKGAAELQELLEAAASYMSFVEGRESFSRPQLINKVRMLEGQEDFNREDSLRSFGQLLREGKLKKASNGRFSVSSQIGFRPGNRAAG